MFYFILFLLSLALTAAALFFFIRSNELSSQLRQAAEAWRQKEEAYTSELDKLEKIRHIPDIIETSAASRRSRSRPNWPKPRGGRTRSSNGPWWRRRITAGSSGLRPSGS